MIQAPTPIILDQLLDSVGEAMNGDFARQLFTLRASADLQEKIDDLAARSNEGQLTAEERVDYENHVQAIHLVGILQKKARKILADRPDS